MTSTTRPNAANDGASARRARVRVGGAHPWGVLSIGYVDRAGGTRYQLTVFPPGITREQRRGLLFRRQWFPWGAIAWFLVASGLSSMMNGWTAIAIGGGIYVGGLLAGNAWAGDARHRVIELNAQLLSLHGSKGAIGAFEAVQYAATSLLHLDQLANAHLIDPVEYEQRWGEIYQAIDARR